MAARGRESLNAVEQTSTRAETVFSPLYTQQLEPASTWMVINIVIVNKTLLESKAAGTEVLI